MINRWLLRCLAGAGFVVACALARAQVVDQQFVPNPANGSFAMGSADAPMQVWAAQSFTAGLTGQLAAADLAIWRTVHGQWNLVVQVHEISGTTIGANLGRAVIPFASMPLIGIGEYPPGTSSLALHVDFAALSIPISAGSTYAIAVSMIGAQVASPERQYYWFSQDVSGSVDHYPGGEVSIRLGDVSGPGNNTFPSEVSRDVGFRTYVTPVPEAPSVQLAGLGLLFLAGRVWLRARRGQ